MVRIKARLCVVRQRKEAVDLATVFNDKRSFPSNIHQPQAFTWILGANEAVRRRGSGQRSALQLNHAELSCHVLGAVSIADICWRDPASEGTVVQNQSMDGR